MVMTHTRAKCQCQRPVGSKATPTVESGGRTDTADRVTFPTNKIPNSEEIPPCLCSFKGINQNIDEIFNSHTNDIKHFNHQMEDWVRFRKL